MASAEKEKNGHRMKLADGTLQLLSGDTTELLVTATQRRGRPEASESGHGPVRFSWKTRWHRSKGIANGGIRTRGAEAWNAELSCSYSVCNTAWEDRTRIPTFFKHV